MGPPGLLSPRHVMHAMVSDPGEVTRSCHIGSTHIGFRMVNGVALPGSHKFRGSIPSTSRLTACMLVVIRLKSGITPFPPMTHYPAVGDLTGAGFPPAR